MRPYEINEQGSANRKDLMSSIFDYNHNIERREHDIKKNSLLLSSNSNNYNNSTYKCFSILINKPHNEKKNSSKKCFFNSNNADTKSRVLGCSYPINNNESNIPIKLTDKPCPKQNKPKKTQTAHLFNKSSIIF